MRVHARRVYILPVPYADKGKQREFQRRWMAERREEWFRENGPCVDCGSWEDLELDHRDPDQKVTHRVWSWSEARREAELAKCDPRCKLCHKRKSSAARKPEIVHGTQYAYNKASCRCAACRTYNTVRIRLYKVGVTKIGLARLLAQKRL